MNDSTETRTYVGETGGQAFDGMAGFRIGRQYEFSYTKEFDEVRSLPLISTQIPF